MIKRMLVSILIGLVIGSMLVFTVVALKNADTVSTKWSSDDDAMHETRGIYWYIPQDDGQLTVISATCDRSWRYIGGQPEDFVVDSCQIVFGR